MAVFTQPIRENYSPLFIEFVEASLPDELSLLYADPRDWERLSLDTEAVFALAAAAAVVATSSSFQRG